MIGATPGPWIKYGRTIGSEVGGRMIVAAIDGAETGSWQLLEFDSPNRKQAMADLAYIVTACNSYDKLLEALKAAAVDLLRLQEQLPVPDWVQTSIDHLRDVVLKAEGKDGQ